MTDSTLLFEKLPSFLINKFSKHSSREIDDFKYVIEQQTRHILIELDEFPHDLSHYIRENNLDYLVLKK